MHRSKSMTSLSQMSQIPFTSFSDFTLYNSDPENLAEYEEDLPDGAQSLPNGAHGMIAVPYDQSTEEETESSEPPPEVISDGNFPTDISFTNTNEVRTVLASQSGFISGRLGTHLQDQKGLIILPLHAVTAIRTIAGNHNMQYPCIVFYPHSYEENLFRSVFPNLMDAIDNLYPS